jgi:RHS repeat-associated protein
MNVKNLRVLSFLLGCLFGFCSSAIAQTYAPKYFFANADYGQYPYTDVWNQFPTSDAAFNDGFGRSGPGHWYVYTVANCQQPQPAGYYDVYISNSMLHTPDHPDGYEWQDTINRYRCPPSNQLLYNGTSTPLELQWADCGNGIIAGYPGQACPANPKDKQPGCHDKPNCERGDPIDVASGNTYSIKTEFRGGGQFPLEFTWTYNSLGLSSGFFATDLVLGINRSHSYQRAIHVYVLPPAPPAPGITSAALARPDGKTFMANFNGTTWSLDADIVGILSSSQDDNGNFLGFTYLNDRNETESYDANGNLLSITDQNGFVQNLARDSNGRIQSVQDSFGRALTFSYDSSSHIQQLTQPDGGVIQFAYDANNNLQTVTYPDQTFMQYNYNESLHTSGASLPNALTTVVDENGQTFTTYNYATNGSGTGNYHGSGVADYTINYSGGMSITTPLGSVETPQFQAILGLNRLTQLTEACTGCTPVTTLDTYAANGHVQNETDRNGNVTAYTYNSSLPLVTQRTDAQGQSAQRVTQTDWNTSLIVPTEVRAYDSNNAVVTKTDYAYNTRGQVLYRCIVDPAISGASSYACGTLRNAPSGVRQWKYTYCDSVGAGCPLVGLLLSVKSPRIDVSDITTDAYYQTTDLSGCATQGGTCHSLGDLQKVTNAMGQVTTYVSYDKSGRVARLQDANGTYTDMSYNSRGWLLARTVRANADGSSSSNDATTTVAYDNVGNVAQVTQPDGSYLHYVYDTAHRLTDIYDSAGQGYLAGNRIHYTRDAAGNRTDEKTTDPNGNLKRELSRQYDQLSRLTKILNSASTTVQAYQNPAEAPPSGVTYTDGYDGNGNAIYSVDGNNVGTEQQYDPLNRLIKTLKDHAGTGATRDTTTQYAYDTRDNLRSLADPDNLATNYTYDGLDNLTVLSSPDTGNTGYTYDAAGNRATQTDARGVVSTYSYDALNRLTGISYPTTSLNISYAYDVTATGCYNTGRLTKITDNSGSTTYCYDRRGNILTKTQITNAVTLTTSYAYTLADRLSSVTYPSGAIVAYGLDSVGRVTSVTYKANAQATAVTVLSGISYYPFGPQNVLTFGNGRRLTKTYDSDYAIDKIVSSNSTGLVIDGTVDVLGNLTNASSTVGANPPTQQYQYDPLYRLTNVQNGSGTSLASFTYDLTGDRLSKTLSGTNSAYTYTSGTHHLASVAGQTRSYDADGNEISGPITYNGTPLYPVTLTFDDRNRLSKLTYGSTSVTENYNGRGERVFKSSKLFSYDEGGQLLGEYTTGGALGAEYVYVDGLPVAYITGGTLYYIETDQLGTPRQVIKPGATTSSDTQMWKWDYFASNSAFGENAPSVQTITFNPRFPGQYFDTETGLDYNYFRDFEPSIGRYVESDPIGLDGGIDTYLYTLGDPLGTFDPDGQNPMLRLCLRFPRACASLAACANNPVRCRALLCKASAAVSRYKIVCTGTPPCRGDESPVTLDLKVVGWCTCFVNRIFEKYVCRRGVSDGGHDGEIENARKQCGKCLHQCVSG